jgi:hypothetical protein
MKEAALRQQTRASDYQATFNSETGKRVLEDMHIQHFMRTPTFSRDALEMAKNEGERNVVLRIMSILGIDIDALNKLTKERGEQNEQVE